MTSINSIFNLGQSGIQTSAAAVSVTAKNITNASNPNHTRQVLTLHALEVREGMPGGVNFGRIARSFDRFAFSNLLREKSHQGAADGRSRVLADAERIATPAGAQTLGDTIDRFFSSLTELALKADDPTARTAVLSNGGDVARRFNEIAEGLSASRRDILTEMGDIASDLTEKLRKIADFNRLIGQNTAEANSPSLPALLDARDALVREVAEEIDINVIYNDKNGVTILSSGSTLVEHSDFARVVVGTDAANNVQVQFVRGTKVNDITSKLDGGRLGGLLEARDTDLVNLKTDIDAFAKDFADAVNLEHLAGEDLNGAAGTLLFSDGTGAVLGVDPAASIQINPNILAAAVPTDLIAAAAVGEGIGGNTQALAMALVAEGSVPALGVASERWALYTGRLGTTLKGAMNELNLRNNTVLHAATVRDSSSGVSLDDEMVALTKYQRGFEAGMRVLQAADEMLSEVIRRLG